MNDGQRLRHTCNGQICSQFIKRKDLIYFYIK